MLVVVVAMIMAMVMTGIVGLALAWVALYSGEMVMAAMHRAFPQVSPPTYGEAGDNARSVGSIAMRAGLGGFTDLSDCFPNLAAGLALVFVERHGPMSLRLSKKL
jgi:hypothetical protein